MAITSRIFSTTQMISFLREGLEQILQISVSEILWQREQNTISFLILSIVSLNCCTSPGVCLIRYKTSRNAVFLPMPGSLANSFTAFSKREEEKIICKYR